MKRLFSYLFLLLFNLFFIFLLLEAGLRYWLSLTEENHETFTKKISADESNFKSNEKRKIEGSSISLGDLIKKSSNLGRVYEFMPDIEATYLGKHFETNSFGMREREISSIKSPDTFRIAGIGDSVMFAWGMEVEDSYLRILEKELNENSKNVKYETLNFAVPGYNTAMEVSTYEDRVRSFSPDLLIMHFVDNDLSIPLFMNKAPDYLSFRKSFLLEQLKKLTSNLKDNNSTSDKDGFVGVEFRGQDETDKKKVLSQYEYMLGSEGFNLAMERLSKLLKEDNIPLVILAGRLKGEMRDLVMNAANKYGFHVVEAYEVVNDYVKKNNIENTPEARKKLLWLNNNDPHPNELGHKLYAKTLKEFLLNSSSQKPLLVIE